MRKTKMKPGEAVLIRGSEMTYLEDVEGKHRFIVQRTENYVESSDILSRCIADYLVSPEDLIPDTQGEGFLMNRYEASFHGEFFVVGRTKGPESFLARLGRQGSGRVQAISPTEDPTFIELREKLRGLGRYSEAPKEVAA